jgi:DNA-binding MarR family transcriptional regulator
MFHNEGMSIRRRRPHRALAGGRPRPAHANPRAELPDVLQFMQVLWAVVHGINGTSKRMSRQIGVTGPQRLVLRVVGLFPGVSPGGLAATLHVHPSTLTGVLRRLVAQRLVRRRANPRDRRQAVLELTTRGARVNSARRGTVESAVARTLKRVHARDRAAAGRVLDRLAHHLKPPGRRPDGGKPEEG